MNSTPKANPLSIQSHDRNSDQGWLVYPVLSRRSQGVSIGINLNPDKRCNFDCIYCQVDRTTLGSVPDVDVELISQQLSHYLERVAQSGGSWQGKPVKDIAFSGDGEPTTCPQYAEVLQEVIRLKRHYGLDHLNLVLITNATRFDNPTFQATLPVFYENRGVVWAKLDAGDEATYREILSTRFPFQRLLGNLVWLGRQYPITLQSMFLQLDEQAFDSGCLKSYIDTVQQLIQQGTQIQTIQAYTIARKTPTDRVKPWSDHTMDQLGSMLRTELPVSVEIYYGSTNTLPS